MTRFRNYLSLICKLPPHANLLSRFSVRNQIATSLAKGEKCDEICFNSLCFNSLSTYQHVSVLSISGHFFSLYLPHFILSLPTPSQIPTIPSLNKTTTPSILHRTNNSSVGPFVQAVQPLHLFLCQFKIKYVCIRLDPMRCIAFRKRDPPLLQTVADEDLRG